MPSTLLHESTGSSVGAETRGPAPAIAAVGTALPSENYSQAELLDLFNITDRKIRSLFLNGGIARRHLILPPPDEAGGRRVETQAEILRKHVKISRELGAAAIDRCLAKIGAPRADVRHLCCVTTTGFVAPGLSAHLIKDLGLDPTCSRLDVVGMGCNAGLNALSPVAAWARQHPGELAVMACIEVCSALYVVDATMETAVVNSLFGDGAAAVAVVAGSEAEPAGPRFLRFSSWMVPEAIDAMRVDWNELHAKFSFFLDPDVPYLVGANAEPACDRLLEGTGVHRSDVAHWIVHSGGKKVIDAIRVNLGLSRHQLRHTLDVLQSCGNVSSGSFLFSLERLLEEQRAVPGDYAAFMTMGPGATIEMALARW